MNEFWRSFEPKINGNNHHGSVTNNKRKERIKRQGQRDMAGIMYQKEIPVV